MQRKYFGTDGIRGNVGDSQITPEFILKLGWAVGRVLIERGESKVLIGKDTRISGYLLESALEAGLSAAGADIYLLGPMPTPGVAYLTRTFHAQTGIVISASHNPYYDNGIKFFSANGSKLADDIELAIEAQLDKKMTTVRSEKLGKAMRIDDAPGRYIEFCKSSVPFTTNLQSLKIVVDCAHGATYHIAPSVFHELGAEVISIGTSPDGLNINLDCGSTHPSLLAKTVLKEKADLGIAFDGDGDRVVMVDHLGELLDGDELVFIMAKYFAKQGRLGGGVVGTVMSNLGMEIALRKEGIDFVRTQVGDRHILAKLAKQGWLLGGEASGHIVWLGATTTGDGIIAALQVLAAMQEAGQCLHDLKAGIEKLPQTLINVPMPTRIDVLKNKQVDSALKTAEQRLGKRGRVLLRLSGTEPLVRVMVEGEDAKEVLSVAEDLAEAVKAVLV